MKPKDIRWHQRLQNYSLALSQLKSAVDLAKKQNLSDLEKQGTIQAFEFTHELAWNLLKDYFEFQGTTSITGSRDASREAFNKNVISSGEVWMEMIKSRNKTSHTYNKSVADEIVVKVQSEYLAAFLELETKMQSLKDQG
jgi:nucleotidyltransferase substrate binding protein (TIGR01987 family)